MNYVNELVSWNEKLLMPVSRLELPDKSGGHYKVKRDKNNWCDSWKITVLSQFTYSGYVCFIKQ